MFRKLLARQIFTLSIALSVFLGAAAPGWAMYAKPLTAMSMLMPVMAGQSDCMGMMDQAVPGKKIPSKTIDTSCGMCVTCALRVSFDVSELVELLYGRSDVVFTHDVNRNGITTLPALPPPII